jgi:hypothetical protein
MRTASASSLKDVVSNDSTLLMSTTTNLNTWLACQASLQVHHTTANLVTQRRLAVLRACRHSLAASSSARGVSGPVSAGALGSERTLAAVAVVANTAGVRCGFPGCGSGACDGVSGSGLGHTGGLCCLLAGKAGEKTRLAGGGGGSGGGASACHDGLIVIMRLCLVC